MGRLGRWVLAVIGAAIITCGALAAREACNREVATQAGAASSGGCATSAKSPASKPCAAMKTAQKARDKAAAKTCGIVTECDGDCATCAEPCPKAHIPVEKRLSAANATKASACDKDCAACPIPCTGQGKTGAAKPDAKAPAPH